MPSAHKASASKYRSSISLKSWKGNSANDLTEETMTTQWMIQTHGDPIGTVRQFVKALWLQANLEGILAPVTSDEKSMVKPRLVENPQLIDEINPFKPVMTMNAARLVPEL